MSDYTTWIGKRVEALGAPGNLHAEGTVIAYTDHPTFTIETDNGERIHWLASLTRLSVDEAQVEALAGVLKALYAERDERVYYSPKVQARRLVERGVRVEGVAR